MKKTFLSMALVALATLGAAAPGWAAPEAVETAAPAVENPNRLAAVLGLASPWGELGLTYQRRFGQMLGLETGFGVGGTGVQVAALPKLLFDFGSASQLYVEGGPSLTLGGREPWSLWAAGEVGVETTFRNKLTLGFGAGASVLTAGTVKFPICFDECKTLGPGTVWPHMRLILGFNF